MSLKDQIAALGRLGSTRRGKAIIRDHREAILLVLGESAAREARMHVEDPDLTRLRRAGL